MLRSFVWLINETNQINETNETNEKRFGVFVVDQTKKRGDKGKETWLRLADGRVYMLEKPIEEKRAWMLWRPS